MEKLKAKHCIILHPEWKKELPDSFHFLVRAERFVDCMSCKIGNIYIEIEAIEQRLQMGTVKLLIPHGLVSAVCLDPEKIIGFAPSTDDKNKESH